MDLTRGADMLNAMTHVAASAKQPALTESTPPRAAYIHVPFCAHRCGYCNFTLVARRDDLIEAYLRAIEIELSWLGEPREVDTLYFGGGTPSHLPPAQLRRLLQLVRAWHPPAAGCEVTVEANPIDLDNARLDLLAAEGVTRLSIGAQSFDAGKLQLLERDHTGDQVRTAVAGARRRFRSVSLDLIFGTPGATLDLWQADLEAVLALRPDHLSTYGLTIEPGTAFFSRHRKGQLREPDEETARALYWAAIERLTAAGLEHYEVSSFALPGHRCRHNEGYWACAGHFAAGPGAARYIAGRRETNHRSTTTWLRRVLAGQSPVAQSEQLGEADAARERLVFGLRRLEGIDRRQFAGHTGWDVDELVGPELRRHVALGMLQDDGRRIRLTREGLLVSDAIWPDFLRV